MNAREAAREIEELSGEILAEAAALPHELIVWQPAPEVWSVMDILCHVEEFLPFWTAQTVGVVRHPEAQWGRDHTDTARRAAVENTAARRLADVTAAIRELAQASSATIGGLSDEDLKVEALSKNPRWGVKPAGFIVEDLLVGHLKKHLGQIRRNVGQYSKG